MYTNNQLSKCLSNSRGKLLSIFCTAGYPEANSTEKLIRYLSNSAVDFIELGIPFSDPVADGETIQKSNGVSIQNGTNLKQVLNLLKEHKNTSRKSILLMGYLNPFLQYGLEELCKDCKEAGVSGLILPDLPPEIYALKFQETVEKYGIHIIHLISPESSDARIRYIDEISSAFIYAVSSNSTTGNHRKSNNAHFLKKLKDMKLKNKLITGFNIRTASDFQQACEFTDGTIIGTQFIKYINEEGLNQTTVQQFVEGIRSPKNKEL